MPSCPEISSCYGSYPVRLASRPPSRPGNAAVPDIELVVARQTQKLLTRQRRPAVSNKAKRSPYTPRAQVAEPEPLLCIGEKF